MTTSSFDFKMALRRQAAATAAAAKDDLTSAQKRLSNAIQDKMPGTAKHIADAAAIRLDEVDILASQVRRNFGAGGLTFDLVVDVVAKMEILDRQLSNRKDA